MVRPAVVLVLLAGLASAAPVPPPRKLSPELLVGRWNFEWGMMKDGWILFLADGRYFSIHQPGDRPHYSGAWIVRGHTLTLYEGRMPCEGSLEAAVWSTAYAVDLDLSDYPTIRGKYGTTDVKLSHP